MKVKEIMTGDVITVLKDSTIEEAARLLAHRRLRGLPVVNQSGALIGIVTEYELVSKEGRTVADIMNPKLLYIGDEERVTLARRHMLEFGVTAVPVLDDTHRPVGVVSLRDLAEEGGGDWEPTGAVATIKATEPIDEGAKRLAESEFHHLVVVDDQHRAATFARFDRRHHPGGTGPEYQYIDFAHGRAFSAARPACHAEPVRVLLLE